MRHIKIGDRTIGPGEPTYIIAEAGVNHNGKLETALRLIDRAKETGADCIKFQTFKANRVASPEATKADYQLKSTDPRESQIEMLRKLELSSGAYQEIIDACEERDIAFLSTPYNREDVDFLDKLGVPAFKLASMHLAEPGFLHYVARRDRPLVVSTGMATLAEVDEAVRTIRDAGNERFLLLQCTTNYPARIEDANLLAMLTMERAFDALVGYSDHTEGVTACLAAVALGARVIEKHFTLNRSLPGPDHACSSDPSEFDRLVRGIREVERALGTSQKTPTEAEVRNSVGMRRSIVARRAISRGEVLTEELIAYRRPGTGLKPALVAELVGLQASRDIDAGEFLSWDMVGGPV